MGVDRRLSTLGGVLSLAPPSGWPILAHWDKRIRIKEKNKICFNYRFELIRMAKVRDQTANRGWYLCKVSLK